MLLDRPRFVALFRCTAALLIALTGSAAASFGQQTVVRDAGGGRKIELDYNTVGKVIQQRTLGPDGKLLSKVDFEYKPGYLGAQQTDTSYWPDGKIHKITRNTYDESSNFTGEFIQVFDESGKQIAGHRLTHDPWTGVYSCQEWNVAAQDYRAIECPSGEESRGPEEVRKFTYDEVMQHLQTARKAPSETRPLKTPGSKEVGVVLPAQVWPGERVSGRVVENPERFEEMPEVTVKRVAVPFEADGAASQLPGWNVEFPGESPQRADGPISFVVPRGPIGLDITFRQAANPARFVSKQLSFSQSPRARKPQTPRLFEAAALCVKGQLCFVRGPFSGDSRKTFAAFGDRPATIVVETSEAAYINVPEPTEPGARPLFIAEGSKLVALPVVVAGLTIRNADRRLQQDQTLIVYPTLAGPESLVDWRRGNFPETNLERARNLVPGFQLPQDHREARGTREADEKKGGEILLVVRNLTLEQVSLRSSKNQKLVFHLSDESFSRGEFKYDLVVEAKKPGNFDVRGYVIPFLAPVRGQEFTRRSASSD